jgi:hypothetical protein
MFLAFLLCGLSLSTHEFLNGLLFVYGMQLYQLMLNSVLHITCFITLCESFLGIDPHWVLWKFLFHLRTSVSLDKKPKLGGAVVSVRFESHYLECRGFVNRSAIEVGVWRFVEGVNAEERSGMVVARVYPASDPATVARSYVLL